eukprot:Opistho-1_new@16502
MSKPLRVGHGRLRRTLRRLTIVDVRAPAPTTGRSARYVRSSRSCFARAQALDRATHGRLTSGHRVPGRQVEGKRLPLRHRSQHFRAVACAPKAHGFDAGHGQFDRHWLLDAQDASHNALAPAAADPSHGGEHSVELVRCRVTPQQRAPIRRRGCPLRVAYTPVGVIDDDEVVSGPYFSLTRGATHHIVRSTVGSRRPPPHRILLLRRGVFPRPRVVELLLLGEHKCANAPVCAHRRNRTLPLRFRLLPLEHAMKARRSGKVDGDHHAVVAARTSLRVHKLVRVEREADRHDTRAHGNVDPLPMYSALI